MGLVAQAFWFGDDEFALVDFARGQGGAGVAPGAVALSLVAFALSHGAAQSWGSGDVFHTYAAGIRVKR